MRALAFARRVLARWDRRVVSPVPLGLVFLQSRAWRRRQAPTALSSRRDMHLHVRVPISLMLVRRARAASEAHYRAGDRTTVFGPLVVRTSAAEGAERIVERLLARGTRVEVSTRMNAVANGEAAPAVPGPAPPLHLTLRRSEPMPSADPREERREGLDAVESSAAAGGARAPALAAGDPIVDVGRLTDQVLAAIDRRFVAQAERLGRS